MYKCTILKASDDSFSRECEINTLEELITLPERKHLINSQVFTEPILTYLMILLDIQPSSNDLTVTIVDAYID